MTRSPAQNAVRAMYRAGRKVAQEVGQSVQELRTGLAVPVPAKLTPGFWMDRAGDWLDEALADADQEEDQRCSG